MESLPTILGTLGLPIFLYFITQTIVIFFIGRGSSSSISRNTRVQLVGAGIFVVILVILGAVTEAGWLIVLAGGGLLLMWVLSHLLAWSLALALRR